jgi:Phage P22-like portal protein
MADAYPTEQPGAADEGDDKAKSGSDEAILKEARERFEYHDSVDNENRRAAREDTEFVWIRGKQWPDQIRNERDAADRPWLEINQLPQFISQVVNDQRQGRPGINIAPASGDASEKVAEILQGMIRHIEYESNAEAAYDSAFAHAVTGGRGYWRVCSEYEGAKSFDQCLTVKRIPDPQSVRIDPDYQDPDAGDICWAFVTETVQKDEFHKRWPKADAVSFDYAGDSDIALWYDGADKIVIADYYRKVETKRKLVVMNDGAVGWKDELPKVLPPGVEIVRERDADDCKVEWFKIAGGEQILEQYEWPGKFIPVVMCVGDEIMVDGKRLFQGLIRRARDVQTMYNFWQTAATELIALAPRSPWVAAHGQLEGFENDWQASNRRNIAVLEYNPITAAGTVMAAPQRTQFAGIPTGIVEQANQCKQDLRATIGIYDPSLGNRSNETSGRAILAREKQGDTATFHFVDNLTRAIALTGRIMVDLIPHYYDTERVVGMIDVEDEAKMVKVNERVPAPFDLAQAIVLNDLSVGRFAVTVEAGPSYATKRQESADSMMQFIQAYPPAAAIAGDLIAKNMDWPGSEQIANRLKLLLPPPIQQAEAEGQEQPIPPQAQAQMQQMGAQLQQAQQMLQELGQENQQLKSGAAEKAQTAQMQIEQKAQEAQANLELEEQHALAKIASDEKIAAAQIASKERIAKLNQETELVIASAKITQDSALNEQQKQVPELAQAIALMAQQMGAVVDSAMAPRHSQLVLDDLGNPLGTVSMALPRNGDAYDAEAPPADGNLASALAQLAQRVQQMSAVQTAPRQSKFVLDAQGNPVGAVNEPVTH